MSKIVKPPLVENASAVADAPVAVSALSSDALARRHMLLKSLGKGSAILAAAAVPIHSLAAPVTIKTTDNTQCIVSGMGSAIHSATTVTGTCQGTKPSNYADPTKWPGYSAKKNGNFTFVVDSKQYTQGTKFKSVFGGSNISTLTDIMAGIAGSSNDQVWIAAWLNAGAGYNNAFGSTAQNFPYSPSQVVARYQSSSLGADGNFQSYTFFTTYLQSL